MNLDVKLAEIDAKLQELAQQHREAESLLSKIVQQEIFYSGQKALLEELLAENIS